MTHAEQTVANMREIDSLKAAVDLLSKRLMVLENRKNEIVVNVPQQAAPVVQYTPPVQEAPVVNVTVPKSEPVINFPEIRNEIQLPENATPVVNVTVPPAEVQVNVPEQKPPIVRNVVTIPEQSKREVKTATKDENGNYTITIERE